MPESKEAARDTNPEPGPSKATDAVDILEALTSPPEMARDIIAQEALSRALSRKTGSLLAQPSRAIIVKVPSLDWVEIIGDTLPTFARKILVRTAEALERDKKVDRRVGADALLHLQHGRTVAFVCPDPDNILDESVLAAADATMIVAPPTAALLRKVIRKISKQTARGVTNEMATLPLPTILTAIRPGLSARGCVANLAQALDRRRTTATPSAPLLTDLPLTASVRRWTDQTLAELAAVKAGTLHPDQLVFATLDGVPGTGKTLAAESLARTAGWTFVPSSVGSWFAEGDGALGGVARNLKGFVDKLLESEPSIGFLDEIDSLPDRATMDNKGRDWWTPIITQFLVEIDRVKKSGKRVLLLAGTNYYERLDAALVRPGRLQQRVTFTLPQGDDELKEFLRHFLADDLLEDDLSALIRFAAGATPAAIEGWVKEARGLARAEHRSLEAGDVLAQMVPKENRSPDDIFAIALHEVGHALIAHRLGHKVETLSIIPRGVSGGRTKSTLPRMIQSMDNIRDTATVMLAGRAADIALGSGPNSGAEADLEAATRILLAAHERHGLNDTLLYVPATRSRPRSSTVEAVASELKTLLDRAIAMIGAERNLALTLADRLIKFRVLSRIEIAACLGEKPRRSADTALDEAEINAIKKRAAS